ncbi:MAG: glycosyltransferase family 39 protein [Patescibacteria group bacterium]
MLGIELLIFIFVARHAQWSLDPYLTGFDTMEYKAIAQNLVLNNTFSKSLEIPLIPNFFRSPGYPFWLAFIYMIFNSFKPAVFLGIIIFATLAPLIYLIIREVFSEKLAFLTGIIFALEPRMAFSAPFLLSEQIFVPVFFLAIFFAIKFFNHPQCNRYMFFSAIFLATSSLIRGISLYLWPVFIIFFFFKLYKTWPMAKILKIFALTTFALISIISPWLLRNRITLGTWQSSSLFGIHLYWGHLETLQRYLGVPQEIAHQKNLDRAIELTGGNFETPESVNILTKSALEEIKNNFGAYIKIYAFNAGLFFITDGYKGIASYIVNLNPNYINLGDYIIKLQIGEVLNHLKSFSLMELFIPIAGRTLWSIIIILSFIGAFISIKKAPAQRLIIALLIFLPVYFALLTGPIFSPDPRFRMPVNGFLFAFALVGIFYFLKKKFQYELSS